MNKKTNNPLLQRYDNFFGENTSNKLIQSKNKLRDNLFVRVNLSKTTTLEIEDFFNNNRIKYSKTMFENAYKIQKSQVNLSSSIPSLSGRMYIQDIASQIPVNTIEFEKLGRLKRTISILDMASSPGSKTTQIADMLNYYNIKYEIICLEPDKKRVTKLINNIQKQNFKNIKIYQKYAQEYKTSKKFDIIMLDAPCSGNLIDDRHWLKKRDIKGIKKKAEIQRELLIKASKLIKQEGQIIYSTCSLEPEENEYNIQFITKKEGLDTKRIDMDFPFKTSPLIKGQNSLRMMPYNSNTQGFFVCKLVKK